MLLSIYQHACPPPHTPAFRGRPCVRGERWCSRCNRGDAHISVAVAGRSFAFRVGLVHLWRGAGVLCCILVFFLLAAVAGRSFAFHVGLVHLLWRGAGASSVKFGQRPGGRIGSGGSLHRRGFPATTLLGNSGHHSVRFITHQSFAFY